MGNKKAEPQLKRFAGFWTLTGQPLGGTEWSVEEKIRRAKAAGFLAMGGGADPTLPTPCMRPGWITFVISTPTNRRGRIV